MKAKILIVEDESIVALDIQDCLTKLDYEVVGVESYGERVLQQVIALKPNLVLMDIRLKGQMDGIEACIAVKKEAGIPVVFLTAYADEGTLQRAKTVVPDGYILKPFESQELHTAIELALYRAEGEHARDTIVEGDDEAPSDAKSFLQSLPLFKALSKEGRDSLLSSARSRQVEIGETLFEEGTRFQKASILMSGRGALVKSSASGKELVVEVLSPGDVLPALLTLTEDTPTATARVQSPAVVVEIPAANLRSVLREENEAMVVATELLVKRLTHSHERTRSLAHDAAELRLATALLSLAPHFARAPRSDGSFAIYITRQELADLAGTTPETAIRVTKGLEREGYLDLTRPGVIRILDPKKFETVARVHA